MQAIHDAAKLEMVWGATERGSVEAYGVYLKKLLAKLCPGYEPKLVHDNEELLTTKSGDPRLPFQLRGTCDVILTHGEQSSSDKQWEFSADPFVRARAVLQLRKDPSSDYENYVARSTAELFALDLKTSEPIVAVLTDLHEDWTLMWLSLKDGKRQFNQVRKTGKQEGLYALRSILELTGDQLRNDHHFVKLNDLSYAER